MGQESLFGAAGSWTNMRPMEIRTAERIDPMAGDETLQRETVYTYYDSAGDAGADRGDANVDCRACHGTGKVLLLVSAEACAACAGTGKTPPAAASACDEPNDGPTTVTEERVAGHFVVTTTYDRLKRPVVRTERFVPDKASVPEKPTVEPSP